ncbi:MAG: hypothetical protein JWR51_2437 [Devosia sp.]|uniref:hypothetical protein n=1 Tax=Devosia sp. TaxID=1871048 RepID=UPI00262BD64D|nr:hypothetical protein [Devosia sp.]MDB5529334.1 hypothetical protein [Devosia sp.]
MRKILLGLLGCAALVQPALADGKVYVQLPDLSGYQDAAAEALLHRLVMANVVSSHCAGFAISDAELWLLLDTADIVAVQLGLDTDLYGGDYSRPAYNALVEEETCPLEGPKVELTLRELVAHGGSRQPLPDQKAAAAAFEPNEFSDFPAWEKTE